MESFIALLISGWGGALLQGLSITIQVSIGGYLTGLTIGALTAWAKLRGPRWAVSLANIYSTICRAVPEVLLILILYYAGQQLINALTDWQGYGSVSIGGFVAALTVLGVVNGAYTSEVLRSAVLAIPRGQIEAAHAYGFHGVTLFRRVIIPLTLPLAFAGLSNLWMTMLKDSALIFVVGYNELTFTSMQAAASTRLYFPFLLLCGAIYYLMTLLSSVVLQQFEHRMRRWTPEVV